VNGARRRRTAGEPCGTGEVAQGSSCAFPDRATAPGPGRSPAESTSMLYEGGMQKMLTSVEATGGPPVVTPVAGEPVSKIVRATSAVVKAPEVRCPQLVKPVTVAQSAFPLAGLHCTGRHGAPLHVLHGAPGGHSWLVGKSPFGLRDSGVHASPSFGPPLHLLVLELQMGQGWTKVLQKPLGQSASVMQPLPLFAPPTQAPVSQVPLAPQSASE